MINKAELGKSGFAIAPIEVGQVYYAVKEGARDLVARLAAMSGRIALFVPEHQQSEKPTIPIFTPVEQVAQKLEIGGYRIVDVLPADNPIQEQFMAGVLEETMIEQARYSPRRVRVKGLRTGENYTFKFTGIGRNSVNEVTGTLSQITKRDFVLSNPRIPEGGIAIILPVRGASTLEGFTADPLASKLDIPRRFLARTPNRPGFTIWQ